MNFNRLLPLIIPLLTLILFEIFFFNPKMIYVVLVLINLVIFFAIWQFSKIGFAIKKLSNEANNISKDWRLCLSGMILPSMMSTAIVVYTILKDNSQL